MTSLSARCRWAHLQHSKRHSSYVGEVFGNADLDAQRLSCSYHVDALFADGFANSTPSATTTNGTGDVPVESPGTKDFDAERELDAAMLPVEVKEQRLSGLIQSILCGACLGENVARLHVCFLSSGVIC